MDQLAQLISQTLIASLLPLNSLPSTVIRLLICCWTVLFPCGSVICVHMCMSACMCTAICSYMRFKCWCKLLFAIWLNSKRKHDCRHFRFVFTELPVGVKQIKPEGSARLYMIILYWQKGIWYIICGYMCLMLKGLWEEIKGNHVELKQEVNRKITGSYF